MNESEMKAMVDQVFEESFEIERHKLKPEMNIFNDLGLDSLDIVDLVVALQKKFGVQIRNDQRLRNIRTLEDVYQFILALAKEGEFKINIDQKSNE